MRLTIRRLGSAAVAAFLAAIMVIAAATSATARPLGRDDTGVTVTTQPPAKVPSADDKREAATQAAQNEREAKAAAAKAAAAKAAAADDKREAATQAAQNEREAKAAAAKAAAAKAAAAKKAAAKACDVPTSLSFDIALSYICREMQTNPQGFLRDMPNPHKWIDFGDIVCAGCRWDHKPKLKKMFVGKPGFPWMAIPGTNKCIYYDVWSNIHYGYVGRAIGLSEWFLTLAHNLDGDNAHSLADNMKVEIGYAVYSHNPDPGLLTAAAIARELNRRLPDLEYAERNKPFKSVKACP